MQSQVVPSLYPQLPGQQLYGTNYNPYSPQTPVSAQQLQPFSSQLSTYNPSNLQNSYGGPSFQSQAIISTQTPSQTQYPYNSIQAQQQSSNQIQPYSQGQSSQNQQSQIQSQQSSYNRPSYQYSQTPQTQLRPQQLESVSKDEDPVYGPLARARGRVDRALLADNEISPDLADLLSVPSEFPPWLSHWVITELISLTMS